MRSHSYENDFDLHENETACRKNMAGTSFYMFWFRFIPEMFSALSAAFFYGRAFVCFSARLALHYFAVYSVLGS